MASPAETALWSEVVESSSSVAFSASSSSGSNERKVSELKKQKLLHDDDDDDDVGAFLKEGGGGEGDEEGGMQVEEKKEGDAGDDEGYRGDYPFYSDSDEEVMEQFRIYEQQIEESEGFDVDYDVVPKVFFFGGVRPIRLHKCDGLLKEALQKSVRSGIDYYNKEKNANLEFVEILKANFRPCSGHLFYITFSARDSGELKTFQTKVFYGWNDEGFCIEVEFTRPKPEINPH